MASSTDFSKVNVSASAAGDAISGSISGQAVTTTTYASENVHLDIDVNTSSGALGHLSADVSAQKPATTANEAVTLTKVTDSWGRTYTISADGKSFTAG